MNILDNYSDRNDNKSFEIKFKCENVNIKFYFRYSINTLYKKICNFIDAYYKDLDYNIILKEKKEFNELIIYILLYFTLINEKKEKIDKEIIPLEEISQFLINCLEI